VRAAFSESEIGTARAVEKKLRNNPVQRLFKNGVNEGREKVEE
jgi:hypothetical protein